MLAAHEASDANAVLAGECQRQQQQRPAFAVIGNHDEGGQVLARADLKLPVGKKIEALIGRGELRRIFEAAPDRLCVAELGNDVDACDAAG